ncbi:MAG TPA: hypothetical protein DEO85_02445 [Maritimibacter sp.]|nr:hypothetical protein [Maritimibacter sp.]
MTAVKAFFIACFTDDDGAVTVDWIVLVAVIVMLGMGAAFYVTSSVPHVANNMSSFLSKTDVGG